MLYHHGIGVFSTQEATQSRAIRRVVVAVSSEIYIAHEPLNQSQLHDKDADEELSW